MACGTAPRRSSWLHNISCQKAGSSGQMRGPGCNPLCLSPGNPVSLVVLPKFPQSHKRVPLPGDQMSNVSLWRMLDAQATTETRQGSFNSHFNLRKPLWTTAVASLDIQRLKYCVWEAHMSHTTPGTILHGLPFLWLSTLILKLMCSFREPMLLSDS